MANSRLEVVGHSSAFTINKMNNADSSRKSLTGKGNLNEDFDYDESYSYAQDQSCELIKRKKAQQ